MFLNLIIFFLLYKLEGANDNSLRLLNKIIRICLIYAYEYTLLNIIKCCSGLLSFVLIQ